MKLKNIKIQNGFTFIETMIYITLISIFISGAISFALNIIYGRVKAQGQQEISQNLRLTSKRIVYEIRNASAINSVAASDLCLASANSTYNPTRIYLSSERLRIGWGGGSTDCTGLTNDQPLTTNRVRVTDLTFTNLSSGTNSYNIKFSLTIENLTGEREEFQKNQTYSSSVELRSN